MFLRGLLLVSSLAGSNKRRKGHTKKETNKEEQRTKGAIGVEGMHFHIWSRGIAVCRATRINNT